MLPLTLTHSIHDHQFSSLAPACQPTCLLVLASSNSCSRAPTIGGKPKGRAPSPTNVQQAQGARCMQSSPAQHVQANPWAVSRASLRSLRDISCRRPAGRHPNRVTYHLPRSKWVGDTETEPHNRSEPRTKTFLSSWAGSFVSLTDLGLSHPNYTTTTTAPTHHHVLPQIFCLRSCMASCVLLVINAAYLTWGGDRHDDGDNDKVTTKHVQVTYNPRYFPGRPFAPNTNIFRRPSILFRQGRCWHQAEQAKRL